MRRASIDNCRKVKYGGVQVRAYILWRHMCSVRGCDSLDLHTENIQVCGKVLPKLFGNIHPKNEQMPLCLRDTRLYSSYEGMERGSAFGGDVNVNNL